MWIGSRVVPCRRTDRKVDGRTDGRMDMTKLTVTFCNFANARKKQNHGVVMLSTAFIHHLQGKTENTFLCVSNKIKSSYGRLYYQSVSAHFCQRVIYHCTE
jgi:hypothetical protein